MEFQITSVENGWLFAEIITAQERIPFANSRVEGGQMPGALLRSLTALLAGSSKEEWICWNGETQVDVWHLVFDGAMLQLEDFCVDGYKTWPVCGDTLAARVKDAQPKMVLAGDGITFAQSVCDAFKAFRTSEGLKQWQEGFSNAFPTEEYQILRRQLRSE